MNPIVAYEEIEQLLFFSHSLETPSVPSTPVDVRDAFQYKLEQAAVSHAILNIDIKLGPDGSLDQLGPVPSWALVPILVGNLMLG